MTYHYWEHIRVAEHCSIVLFSSKSLVAQGILTGLSEDVDSYSITGQKCLWKVLCFEKQYFVESPLAAITAVSLSDLCLSTPGLCNIFLLFFPKFFNLCQIGC
jgi:hypothetical protein